MAKILSIIAQEGYQDQEYSDSKTALENAGHEVVTASTAQETFGKFGTKTKVDLLVKDINPDNYDALALIGGPGCYQYFEDTFVHEIAKNFYNAGKPTCAICAAPSILANAGLLNGKKATCWEGESTNLIAKNALYTGEMITQDGNIITANGPLSAKEFGKTIAKAIKQTS